MTISFLGILYIIMVINREMNVIFVIMTGSAKKIRKPKPWKHPQPITKSQLLQMREEFWDTSPHYGGRTGTFSGMSYHLSLFTRIFHRN